MYLLYNIIAFCAGAIIGDSADRLHRRGGLAREAPETPGGGGLRKEQIISSARNAAIRAICTKASCHIARVAARK